MKKLSKMILINSSHVSYAEIALDGNVFFTGTSGTGKTTVEKPIIFFYCADTRYLGKTEDGGQSYVEYAYPHRGSWVIYEVQREEGPFMVVTYQRQNRIMFRFVDCPYEKRYFIDSSNRAREDWKDVEEQLDQEVYRSHVIKAYKDYADIIYGTTLNKSLARFSMMSGNKYEGIQKAIMSIFLNKGVDAQGIKDTIIDSIGESDGLPIAFYREKTKNLVHEYEDIRKWYTTGKNGRVKVRDDADAVMNRHSECKAAGESIIKLGARLKSAVIRDRNEIEKSGKDLQALQTKLETAIRQLNSEKERFEKEHDKLKAKIAVLDNLLNTTRDKKKHYDEAGIEEIGKQIEKEPELKARQNQLSTQIDILTTNEKDIRAKYKKLDEAAALQLEQMANLFMKKETDAGNEAARKKNEIIEKTSRESDAARERHTATDGKIQQMIDEAQRDFYRLLMKKQQIKDHSPFAENIKETRTRLKNLAEEENSLEREFEKKKMEIDRYRTEAETSRKELERQHGAEADEIVRMRKELSCKAEELDALLAKKDGSFIEWLESNMEGWQDSIGKVIDRDVLYMDGLEPVKKETGDTLYGVSLNLSSLEKNVETPVKMLREKEQLEKKIANLDEKSEALQEDFRNKMDTLVKKQSDTLKTMQAKERDIDAKLKQIPREKEKLNRALEDYEARTREEREKLMKEVNAENIQAEALLHAHMQKKKEEHDYYLSETNRIMKEKEKAIREVDRIMDAAIKEIRRGLEEQKAEAETAQMERNGKMLEELKGKGVDTQAISALQAQKKKVAEQLQKIEESRKIWYNWEKDKEDYFDKEAERKEERKALQKDADSLEYEYQYRKQKKENERREAEDKITATRQREEKIKDGLDRAEQFFSGGSCPSEIETVKPEDTTEPLIDMLDRLRDEIAMKQQKTHEFMKAVKQFQGNFSDNNIFNFRTVFLSEEDYTDLANQLHDFILNNSIEEYRSRTNKFYSEIIKRLSKEIGRLEENRSQVNNIINDINRDFRENNFAGVIRDIAMRVVDSGDSIVQQLFTLKRFHDENAFSLGELNLFSGNENPDEINGKAKELLMEFVRTMDDKNDKNSVTLSDIFDIEFRIKENDNDTGWTGYIRNIGSNGTDVLVKAIINIMLLNVFKKKNAGRSTDTILHCIVDESARVSSEYIEGLLKFANARNIHMVNSSGYAEGSSHYRYIYAFRKNKAFVTSVTRAVTKSK